MVENQNKQRTTLTEDDLKQKEYISLKVGESAEFTIKQIDKVQVEPDFALAKSNYRFEILTSEGRVLSVSSWKLWNALRDALKNKEIHGTKVSVVHVGTGLYDVKVI